jgi:Flp pilus assembly protein TadD
MNIHELILSIETAKQENNYSKARDLALEGLRDFTDDYRLYEELADIYLFEGNLEKADEVLSIARELHPESWTGMYLDGYIATAKWEFERAIETLSKANKDMPNNAEILRNLGWAYVMTTNLARGIPLLQRAHILAPDEPMIIIDLSVALIAAGKEAEAKEILAKLGEPKLVEITKWTPLL